MSRMTFINLPVQNLNKTVEFFTAIGFTFDQRFTDEKSTCMNISDEAYAMLMVAPMFKGFTSREVADPATTSEVIVSLSTESRTEVDDLTEKALAAGAEDLGADDQGFMYMRGFRDLDGHQWSFMYMDMSSVPAQ